MEHTRMTKSEGAGSGHSVVRFLLAGILLVAAVLKGYQLGTEPTAETGLMTSRWFLVGVVEFELLLGLCLVWGLMPRAVWLVTVGCFSLFTCVSLYKALSGAVSCGCFGAVQVNPWFTFSLDTAAVFALVRWRPDLSGPIRWVGGSKAASQLVGVVGVWLIVGLPAGWGMASFEAATVSLEGEFLGDGDIVVLEPETWVGRRFPLLGHIDIGDRLAEGKWVVVLFHHDCPQCQEVLPGYEMLETAALVEVPPFAPHDEFGSAGLAQHGRLAESKDWFVQTPTEIRLDGGTVVAVRDAESLEQEREAEASEPIVAITLVDTFEDLP